MTGPASSPRPRSWLVVVGVLLVVGAAAVAGYLLLRDGGEEDVLGPAAAPVDDGRFAAFGAVEVRLRAPDGPIRDHCVLAADTEEQRQRGLMEVTDLAGYAGMLFRFPDERTRSFWMRNTPMPLSIAYFGAGGGFVSSVDMAPCGDRDDCPRYTSDGPAQYALEVPQGRLDEAGADEGSVLTVIGPCDP